MVWSHDLRRAALIIEGDDAFGRPGKVGNDKADAGIKLDPGKVAAHLVRRSPYRVLEQVSNPVLQDPSWFSIKY
jgi:hypothetical protein